MRIGVLALALGLAAGPTVAQELSPRSYWPAPKGTQLLITGFSYSTGDIITDPSLPIVGVDSRINVGLLGYLRTLNLAGRTANIIVEVPYSWGSTAGVVNGDPVDVDVSGLADVSVTLSANILGAPTMNPEQFQQLRADPHSILGASLKIVAPIGEYEEDQLINVGTNRWSVKAEMGYMVPIRPRWLFEFELGAVFYTDNEEFLGVTREQAPIFTGEIHFVKRFRPGFWAALDLNYYTGGRSTIGGEDLADLQRNGRIGVTLVYPFRGRYAIKAGYSVGVVTASGGDFDNLLLSYQVLFR